MKFLKRLIIWLVVIAGIYLIMALIGPKDYKVERTKTIATPVNYLWEQVSVFKNWPNWSPWQEKDPSVKNTFEGTEGTVGSTMKWVGDKDLSGTGQMVISGIDENASINYDLSFVVPFEMSSRGYFKFAETEGNTNVSWADEGDIPFMMRPMMMFMDMDKQIGPDFERGLEKLDSIAVVNYAEDQERMKMEAEAAKAAMANDSTAVAEQEM